MIIDKDHYSSRIDADMAKKDVTPTLMCLLSKLSHKLDHMLPAILIGNMVTSLITSHPTPLLVALGILVRNRSLIEELHSIGVSCSYQEVLNFKGTGQ
jgi:hypothetical protein